MKITDIKVFPTQVGNHSQFLVKVETDEGIYGWGEGGLANHERAVRGVIEYFKGFLIGNCSRSCWSLRDHAIRYRPVRGWESTLMRRSPPHVQAARPVSITSIGETARTQTGRRHMYG